MQPREWDPNLISGSSGELAGRFRQAWVGVDDPQTASVELLPVRLARACRQVLPVDGAGLSVYDDDFRVPLGASDEMSTLAERLQFSQGQGPCLDAGRDGRVLVADAAQIMNRWPSFAEQLLEHTPYRGVISLPLQVTDGSRGALDLFLVDPDRLLLVRLADAVAITDQVGEALRTGEQDDPDAQQESDLPAPSWLRTPAARRRANVWVAMGMAMGRFHLSATDALALLRSYAYGHDTDLDQVAAGVMEGTIDLRGMLP
jgi:hypothetical protein